VVVHTTIGASMLETTGEGCTNLWDFVMRLRLDSMDEIGELDRVLDEEDWNVVSNNIPVTLLCETVSTALLPLTRRSTSAILASSGTETTHREEHTADVLAIEYHVY
jgi:hypothetical protein